MGRRQLFEFVDQPWFPAYFRDSTTELLVFILNTDRVYRNVTADLARAMKRMGTRQVIDIGSGGGGPWPTLVKRFEEREGYPIRVLLTDLYPNLKLCARVREQTGGRVDFSPDPVDAMDMPRRLEGFRTLFSALHHFNPEQVRGLIRDAVVKKQGFAAFEFTQNSALGIGSFIFAPLIFLLAPLFIRPFKWSRLFWTYLAPVIPLTVTFDGIVSCLRTYSIPELENITREFPEYTWEISHKGAFPSLTPVTSLIGYPK